MAQEPGNGGLACAGCGYDLAGLEPSGVCPECGMAVARSAAVMEGRGRARWLGRVAWGAGMAAAGCGCFAALGPAMALGAALGTGWEWVTRWAWWAAGVGMVLWTVGWWMAGGKGPQAKLPHSQMENAGGWVLRGLVVTGVVPVATLAIAWAWAESGGTYSALGMLVISGMAVLAMIAVVWMAGFLWMAEVCARLRRARLATACRMAVLLLMLGGLAGFATWPVGFGVAAVMVFGYGGVVLGMVGRGAGGARGKSQIANST